MTERQYLDYIQDIVRGGVQSPAGFQLRIALREILPPIWRHFLRSRGEKSIHFL